LIRFIFGVLVGVLSGASLTMMLAPRPGRELRHDLAARVAEMKDHARTRYRRRQSSEP
jgi:gas vesicle protein